MRICVTGGSGFIGSALIQELNARGIDEIIVVDDIGDSFKWKNLCGKKFLDIIPICDSLQFLMQSDPLLTHVVHFGACADTTEKNGDYLLENNYRYSKELFHFAESKKIRFIYASSAATYGDGSNGFSDDEQALFSLRPLNMYGYSKHLFDLYLYRRGFLKSALGLKFFNVYGPNEYHKGKMASAILRMVPEVLSTASIKLFASNNPLYADGEQVRDFIYVKDAVSIVADLVDHSFCGILNVGSGEAVSWNRLSRAVFSALQKPVSIMYEPMPNELVGSYQYYTKADVRKLTTVLKRDPCVFSLEKAVKDYIDNYILQENRW